MLDAPLQLPWDISSEMSAYLFRLEHVSADCLLTPEEVRTLLANPNPHPLTPDPSFSP